MPIVPDNQDIANLEQFLNIPERVAAWDLEVDYRRSYAHLILCHIGHLYYATRCFDINAEEIERIAEWLNIREDTQKWCLRVPKEDVVTVEETYL